MITPYSIRFTLSSGFVIDVQPLPPYYIDFLDDEYPLLKYPKRIVQLAGGDTAEFDYTPPEAAPEPSDVEEYELYIKWHNVQQRNVDIEKQRARAKRDFLLATCITIVSGPVDISDNVWVEKLEGVFPDIVIPDDVGGRMVMFLKTVVIRTTEEFEPIVHASLFPEVTMQGIQAALQGFRDPMGRSTNRKRHRR